VGKSIKERFLLRVIIPDDKNECWVWKGAIYNSGYGQTNFMGKKISAHRLAYKLFIGEIPDGKCILHICNTRHCCNPDHLFLGTNLDNTKDMIRKGRSNPCRGAKNGMSVLTERDIPKIRRMISVGCSMNRIADIYHVCPATIRGIKTKRTWAHV